MKTKKLKLSRDRNKTLNAAIKKVIDHGELSPFDEALRNIMNGSSPTSAERDLVRDAVNAYQDALVYGNSVVRAADPQTPSNAVGMPNGDSHYRREVRSQQRQLESIFDSYRSSHPDCQINITNDSSDYITITINNNRTHNGTRQIISYRDLQDCPNSFELIDHTLREMFFRVDGEHERYNPRQQSSIRTSEYGYQVQYAYAQGSGTLTGNQAQQSISDNPSSLSGLLRETYSDQLQAIVPSSNTGLLNNPNEITFSRVMPGEPNQILVVGGASPTWETPYLDRPSGWVQTDSVLAPAARVEIVQDLIQSGTITTGQAMNLLRYEDKNE